MFVQVEEVTFERDPPPAGRPQQQQQQQQLGHIKSTNITFKSQEYADLAYSKLKTAKVCNCITTHVIKPLQASPVLVSICMTYIQCGAMCSVVNQTLAVV
jgi:hypothetical protein